MWEWEAGTSCPSTGGEVQLGLQQICQNIKGPNTDNNPENDVTPVTVESCAVCLFLVCVVRAGQKNTSCNTCYVHGGEYFLSQVHLESLLMTRIRAAFSSLSLWLSARRSPRTCRHIRRHRFSLNALRKTNSALKRQNTAGLMHFQSTGNFTRLLQRFTATVNRFLQPVLNLLSFFNKDSANHQFH